MTQSTHGPRLREIEFGACREALGIPNNFADDNRLLTDGTLEELPKLTFVRHILDGKPISGCRFEIPSTTKGAIRIAVSDSNSVVKIGAHTRLILDLRLWRSPYVEIGDYTTINSARFVADKSDIIVGSDCMFSDEILIQSSDQHGIWDLATGTLVNGGRRRIEIQDHVWVGRKVTVMPDVTVGAGSLLGTGATVTKSIEMCSVAVGVPAKTVRSGISWTRHPSQKNVREESFFSKVSGQSS